VYFQRAPVTLRESGGMQLCVLQQARIFLFIATCEVNKSMTLPGQTSLSL